MIVKTMLEGKASGVSCVAPDVSILAAVEQLAEMRVGALVVTDGAGKVAGVFSERDVIRGVAERGGSILDGQVRDLMTSEVITVSPEDSIDHLMTLMTDQRIRHLPVVENDTLVGIVSIGDVVKHKIAEAEGEAEALRAYIAG